MKSRPMHPETLAIHAGRAVDPTTGAIAPPLYLSTTFEREPDGSYPAGFDYIRDGHPNRRALEQTLAALEGGRHAVAFASGSAAAMAVFHACGGKHIVASHDAYHGTLRQIRDVLPRWGTEVTFVATTSLDAVRAALTADTALLWVETPSNPLLRISDLTAIAAAAKEHGIAMAVDNTFATPVLQRPLGLGADLVVHSTTKFIGGHSDVCGGAVVGNDGQIIDRVQEYHKRGGAVPSAFDCWLLQRSLATLPLRVRQQSASAMAIAAFLERHPAVESVSYPGLPSHPDHELARRQMNGYGGMLSFCVHGGRDEAFGVAARVDTITRATSLGGVESLIEHRASVEGPQSHAPPNLLRLAVGLEHPDDLVADLAQALDA